MGRKARDKKPRLAPTSPPAIGAVRVDGPASRATTAPPRASRHRGTPLLPPRVWLWAIALFAATSAAYMGSLETPFLLDDPVSITKSPEIKQPLRIVALLSDPRALVTATLRWNYLTGGFQVTDYHVFNVLAHAVTGWVVFLLCWVTLHLPVFGERYKRSAESLAGVVALIFLLHPIQTESVTYVIQRSEIFVSAALLGALLSLVAMRNAVTRRSLAMLAAVCVFGVYSKPSFAVVPALLLVYDVCLVSRGKVAEVARRWPAYLLAAVAALATLALTIVAGGFEGESSGFYMRDVTPVGYLSVQFGVVVHYLRVALWPVNLCFDCGYYGPWPVLPTVLGDSVALPAAILAGLGLASLACWRRQPLLTFAFGASAVALSPTSSIVPLADFYVEHRMYLPIAFLAMALVPAFHDASAAVASRFAVAPRTVRALRGAVAVVAVVALAGATLARNRLYTDPVALMENALAQAPQNERVQYNLANAYKSRGRLDDAIPRYEAAIRLIPQVGRSYVNLGSLYMEQGKLEDALRVYRAGAEAAPKWGVLHRMVATVALRLGRAEEALLSAEQAMKVEPGHATGYGLAGLALQKLGRGSEAVEVWRAGLAAKPGDPTLTGYLETP